MLIEKRWNWLNLDYWTFFPSTARRRHSLIALPCSRISDPLNCLSHLNTFKYMYRIYTNNMPPQFRPEMHTSAWFLPSLAESLARKEKLEAGVGVLLFQFLSLIRNLSAILFCSFYYLSVSRWWLFLFAVGFCCWVLEVRSEVAIPPCSFWFEWSTPNGRKHISPLHKNPVWSQKKKGNGSATT